MKKILTILIPLLLLLLLIITAGYIKRKLHDKENTNEQNGAQELTNNQSGSAADWKQYTYDQIGLTFSAPSDMTVTGNLDSGSIFTLNIEGGKYPDEDYYQLYGVLQQTENPTYDTESVKSELLDGSKETTIGGFKAVQGQYKGERNRLVTFIFTNIGIFKLATSQPTSDNEKTTQDILNTFTFSNPHSSPTSNKTTEQAIQSLLATKYNRPLSDVKVTVTKEVQGFAKGSVLFGQVGPGEGGMWLALLGNGWAVVWDGNGNVDCDKMRQEYGNPDTILKPDLCD